MNKYKINYTSLFGTKASTFISAKSFSAAIKRFKNKYNNRYEIDSIETI